DLAREDRERQDRRPEEGDLDLCEENLGEVGINETAAGLLQQDVGQRLRQKIEDVLGEIETDEECHEKGGDRIEQTGPQLDQMIEQRHLLCVFGIGHGLCALRR